MLNKLKISKSESSLIFIGSGLLSEVLFKFNNFKISLIKSEKLILLLLSLTFPISNSTLKLARPLPFSSSTYWLTVLFIQLRDTIAPPGIRFPSLSVTLNGIIMFSPFLIITSSTLIIGVTLVLFKLLSPLFV